MKRIILGCALIMILAVTTASHAEVKAGTYSLTPFIGGYTFESNEDLKNSPVYGLRGGYQFTKTGELKASSVTPRRKSNPWLGIPM